MGIAILVTLYLGVAILLFHIEWSQSWRKAVRVWSGLMALLWPLLVIALFTNLLNPSGKDAA